MQDNRFFSSNYTQIPNVLFDYWLYVLSPAEFKVLCFMCRMTFGFHRENWQLSKKKICEKTGVSPTGVKDSLKVLMEHQLIEKEAVYSEDGGCDANIYKVKVIYEGGHSVPGGSSETTTGGGTLSVPAPGHSVSRVSQNASYTIKERDIKESYVGDLAKTECAKAPPPKKKQDFYFNQEMGRFEKISQEDKLRWKEIYPHIDLDKSIIECEEYLVGKPSKAKSIKLWRSFLNNWMKKGNQWAASKINFTTQGQKVDRRTKNADGTAVEADYGW